jgi:hypothetical protein
LRLGRVLAASVGTLVYSAGRGRKAVAFFTPEPRPVSVRRVHEVAPKP